MMMESARRASRSASSGPRRARAEARSSRKGTRSRRDIAAGRSITPGKITRDRGDGTYDISYDDGERETRVEERLIKKKDGGGGSDSFREGDKIEAIIEAGASLPRAKLAETAGTTPTISTTTTASGRRAFRSA